MEFISWQKYYSEWKDKKPLNEIVANYNLWVYQYETFEQTLWLQKSNEDDTVQQFSGFILQENRDYLLQEDGSRIYL